MKIDIDINSILINIMNTPTSEISNTNKSKKSVKPKSKPILTIVDNEINNKSENELKENSVESTAVIEMENIKILNGDCLELMKTIPDNTVNLILCDLPYGTTKCKWDSVIDTDKLWTEYKRILIKPTGVVVLFGQQPFTTKLISANYDWFKYNIIWKKNKTTQYLLANYRPMKCTEDICVFSPGGAAAASRHKGNMTYNPQNLVPVNIVKKNSEKRIGKMLNQVHHLGPNNKLTSDTEYKQSFTNYPTELIEFDIESDTIHETQKPIKLIEYLIKTYSNEGDLVLDNVLIQIESLLVLNLKKNTLNYHIKGFFPQNMTTNIV